MSSIVVSDVVKDFAGVRALDHVSLEVIEGETLGVIGPNGSGKTTLVNVISGVLSSTEGRIMIHGVDVTGKPGHAVAAHGLSRTFQNIRLFGTLTVLENVMVGAEFGARTDRSVASRAVALEVLRELELDEMAHDLATAKSYGVQRRIEIARAVASGARTLALDEPASGMNDDETHQLLQTLIGLRERRSLSMLIIDHDLRLIMNLCDRIAVLNEGRLLRVGTPTEIRNDPEVIEAYLGVEEGEADHALGG